jgi:peptide/nickel transport system permease protein
VSTVPGTSVPTSAPAATAAAIGAAAPMPRPRSALVQFWRSFSRNRLAVCGGAVVAVLILTAVLAPLLAAWDPHKPDTKKILHPPSRSHWLGTDQLGRDVLSRVLYGSRVSLAVGFVSVGIATLIGILLGAAAGYHGGLIEGSIMRLVDLMLVFPRFFLLLAVLAFIQPSIWTIMAVIGLPAAILTESGLSFLGLGVQPPYATWGNILNDGKDAIEIAWWMTLYPGLAILVTVLSYNLLGEGIRDALDPRLRRSR